MAADQQADAVPHDGRDETQNERMDRNWIELLQELRVTQTGTQILVQWIPAHPGLPATVCLSRYVAAEPVRCPGAAGGHHHRAGPGPGQSAPGALPPAAETVDRQIRPPRASSSARRRCPHRRWHCAADPGRRCRSPRRTGRRGRHLSAGRDSGQPPALLPPHTRHGARGGSTLRSVTPANPDQRIDGIISRCWMVGRVLACAVP